MVLGKKGLEMRFIVLVILGLMVLLIIALVFYFGIDWFVQQIRSIFVEVNATRPAIPKLQ